MLCLSWTGSLHLLRSLPLSQTRSERRKKVDQTSGRLGKRHYILKRCSTIVQWISANTCTDFSRSLVPLFKHLIHILVSELTGMNLSCVGQHTATLSSQVALWKYTFYKIMLWSKLNVKTCSRRLSPYLLPNARRKNLPPDSILPPNADSARSHQRRHRSLICISCYKSRYRQNLISNFPERTNGAFVQSNVTNAVRRCRGQLQDNKYYCILLPSKHRQDRKYRAYS